MNVNGFSTVSHPGTSGTFSPGSAPAGAQPLRTYDCLWDYPAPYTPPGGLKDGAPPALGQFPLNGVAGGSRPASPGHGTNLRAGGQEFWANGTAGPMGLNFDSQELYDSFHEQSFELMQNGPDGFYAAGQSSPILSSDTQPFPLAPGEPDPSQGDADGAAKEMPTTTTTTTTTTAAAAENRGGLVGSQELEEAQPGRSPGGLAELWGVGRWGSGRWVLDPG